MVFLGKTDDELCPVSALLMYLAKHPGPRSGPLLIREDGQPLSRDHFVHYLKEALGRCGIDSGRYSGHSFRIGVATTAAQAGVPDHLIKAMGRWNSEAYQVYIQSPFCPSSGSSIFVKRLELMDCHVFHVCFLVVLFF